ncbi:MAG: hypothetical protein KA190_18885, partial [Kofleriaceae bacterium]|nr:hypothetical protein [Kofleriaceae bacterium]
NPTSTGAGATTPTAEAGSPDAEPRAITAWLVTGVKAERGGVRYQTTAPRIRIYDDGGVAVGSIEVGREPWLGASAQLRIDGKGRGAAAAFALSIAASRRVELELAVLLSNDLGGYVGARGHLLRGPIRPVLSAGVPLFYSGGEPRVGVRGAVGLELTINGHLGVVGEVGAEHFFNPQLGYEANAVVPVVGVIGRL